MRLHALLLVVLAACGAFSSTADPAVDNDAGATSNDGSAVVDAPVGGDGDVDGAAAPPVETVFAGGGESSSITVTNDRVFWTDRDEGKIRIAKLDGADPEEINVGNAPSGVLVFGNYLVWSDNGGAMSVRRRDLTSTEVKALFSGGAVRTVVATGANILAVTVTTVYEIDIEGNVLAAYGGLTNAYGAVPCRGKTFVTDSANARILQGTAADGGTAEDFATGESDVQSITCAADGTVAWTRPSYNSIRAVAPMGVAPTLVADGEMGAFSIAADGNDLYWLTADGKLRKKGAGGLSTLAQGFTASALQSWMRAIAFSPTHVYWLAAGKVLRRLK